jgi:hypothetical protein
MKLKFAKIFSITLILITLVTGCTNYKQTFVDEAKGILDSYQVDGKALMIYDQKLEDYDVYNMSISSEKFADIPDSQKRAILLKLDAIHVSNSKMIAMPEITSQGHTFSLDYNDRLERDGDIYPPRPTLVKPTSVPFVMSQGDFERSWNIYDSTYNSLGGILTIRKQGSKYSQTLLMSDGSSETGSLSVKVVNGEERLHDDRFDDYYGDYMLIGKDGYLNFYDKQGFIYSVPPLK